MNFQVPVKILKEIALEGGKDYSDLFRSWHKDNDTVELPSRQLTKEEIEVISKKATQYKGSEFDRDKEFSSLARKMSTYQRLHKEAGTKKLRRLTDISEAFKAFVKANLPNGIVYEENHNRLDPYVAIACDYEPYDERNESPAHVSFTFRASKYGKKTNSGFTIYGDDLRKYEGGGMTIFEMLAKNGLLLETKELNDEYKEYLDKYIMLREKVGDVWIGSGYADAVEEDGYRGKPFYFKKNISPKVILDFKGRAELSNTRDNNFKETIIEHSKILEERVQLPVHTYGEVWHLDEHTWLQTHVGNLHPYKWKGEGLMDKLILPKTDKDLIRILMNMSKMEIEDIVEGKQGGSFILATGEPGTGKTLSAEVFSEVLERGLYKVQCSQLGITVETVEEKLNTVLNRASRWGAVLLLDEGDVYVRSREKDINQNAIVGVFLRTLEYYRGILFMTSNLQTEIDDAILSRATAHLEYKIPTIVERKQIWEVLSRQFDIEFNMDELDELTEYFDDIVGRDIKALLKLAKMLAIGKDQRCDVPLIKEVSGFVPNVNKKKRVMPTV